MKNLWPFFEHMTFSDMIDILIVSLIVYNILLIIRGTRAVQIIFGFIILAVLFWSSIYYKFYAVNWILSHFFDYSFFILIVLFQDQIRHALASFGGTRFLSKNDLSKFERAIEEVVTASGALGRERIGALIVFEKNNGLMAFSATGTTLVSKIHSDIIYSIFQKNSPLHDGAMIIVDGRIQAAGCFLPLSKNVEIDRHYGTRHRAALGITEVSDAVVVIVSEETTKINICYNGTFYLMENEEKLRRFLKKFLLEDTKLVPIEVGAHR